MLRSPAVLSLLAALALAGCSKAESSKESARKPPATGETAKDPAPETKKEPGGAVAADPKHEGGNGGTGDSDGSGPGEGDGTGPGNGSGKVAPKGGHDPEGGKVKSPPPESGNGGSEPTPTTGGGGDDSFKLTIDQPAGGAPGAEVVARVKVTPGAGYKINHEFPTKLTLETVDGVTIADATLDKGEAETFEDQALVFAVKLTPQSAGEYSVPGKIKFAVCTDATCDPKRQNVSIKVAAK